MTKVEREEADKLFKKLYCSGISDSEIARKMGIGRNSVFQRRQKLGLAKNDPIYTGDSEEQIYRCLHCPLTEPVCGGDLRNCHVTENEMEGLL